MFNASASLRAGTGISSGTDDYAYPFSSFNFSVEINVPNVSSRICKGGFAECDGLDMTVEVKSIREGGSNDRQIRLAGPVSYGQVTLKRGMTATYDLWHWFQEVNRKPELRADAYIVVMTPDHKPRLRFLLKRCMPVKLKAPGLNAKDGIVAIEEFQMVYESLILQPQT
jgi:phage tail-like protein